MSPSAVDVAASAPSVDSSPRWARYGVPRPPAPAIARPPAPAAPRRRKSRRGSSEVFSGSWSGVVSRSPVFIAASSGSFPPEASFGAAPWKKLGAPMGGMDCRSQLVQLAGLLARGGLLGGRLLGRGLLRRRLGGLLGRGLIRGGLPGRLVLVTRIRLRI